MKAQAAEAVAPRKVPEEVLQMAATEVAAEVHGRMRDFMNTTNKQHLRGVVLSGKGVLSRGAAILCLLLAMLTMVWGNSIDSKERASYAEDYPLMNSGQGYVTESFVVDMDVDKDCVYNVTEKIKVNFQEARRGIFRYIPYQKGNSRIDDIVVEGEDVDISDENSSNGNMVKVVRIGNPDRYLTGRHEYTIKYKIVGTYNDLKSVSKDNFDEGFSEGVSGMFKNRSYSNGKDDYLYVDLIPSEWQTGINYVKATINMPKDVDWSKMKVYTGLYGSKESSDKISVTTKERSATFEAVNWPVTSGMTLYGPVGSGYWENVEKASRVYDSLYVLAILFAVLMAVLWFFVGRDKKYVKTVEFYPPEDMTPMEVGYVIDGKVNDEDRVSNFVYVAGRGYMDIEQDPKDEKKFTFRKREDFDKNQFENEKSFIRLFVNNLFASDNEVRSDKFPKSFLRDFRSGDKMMMDYYKRGKGVFTGGSVALQGILTVFLILSSIFTVIYTIVEGVFAKSFLSIVGVGILECALLVAFFITMISFAYKSESITGRSKTKLIMGVVPLAVVVLILNAVLYFYLIGLPSLGVVMIISKAVCIFSIAFMHRRSKYGTQLMGKVMGFRDFIEKAELPMIKSLVEKDPAYFYKILPYAYVFGLTNKWIKNFEGLNIDPPDWYYSNGYDMNNMIFPLYMASSLNSLNFSIKTNIASAVSSSSDFGGGGGSFGGRGFSGGGFSGGGFGGGGGGAW